MSRIRPRHLFAALLLLAAVAFLLRPAPSSASPATITAAALQATTAAATAARTFFPRNDDGGGFFQAAPRGGQRTEVQCYDPASPMDLRSMVIQNSRNSPVYMRVGPCGTQGRACVNSEMYADAGLPTVNAVCAAGGTR